MKATTMFACAALLVLAAGCGNTPGKVCSKLFELDALPMGGGVDGCEVKWTKRKSDSPEKYAAEAQCVLSATSKADLQKCAP